MLQSLNTTTPSPFCHRFLFDPSKLPRVSQISWTGRLKMRNPPRRGWQNHTPASRVTPGRHANGEGRRFLWAKKDKPTDQFDQDLFKTDHNSNVGVSKKAVLLHATLCPRLVNVARAGRASHRHVLRQLRIQTWTESKAHFQWDAVEIDLSLSTRGATNVLQPVQLAAAPIWESGRDKSEHNLPTTCMQKPTFWCDTV